MMLAAPQRLTVASYLFTFSHLDWLRWMVWLVALRFGCSSFVYTPARGGAVASPREGAWALGSLNLMQKRSGNTLGFSRW